VVACVRGLVRRDEARLDAVSALCRARALRPALRVAREVQTGEFHDLVWDEAALALVRAGRLHRAFRVLDREEPLPPSRAAEELVRAATRRGDLDLAWTVVDMWQGRRDEEARLLLALVEEQLAGRNLGGAWRTAREVAERAPVGTAAVLAAVGAHVAR